MVVAEIEPISIIDAVSLVVDDDPFVRLGLVVGVDAVAASTTAVIA